MRHDAADQEKSKVGEGLVSDRHSQNSDVAPLMVKVPLDKLGKTPAQVTTRALGMFSDKSVQVESGITFDKDVSGLYNLYEKGCSDMVYMYV